MTTKLATKTGIGRITRRLVASSIFKRVNKMTKSEISLETNSASLLYFIPCIP